MADKSDPTDLTAMFTGLLTQQAEMAQQFFAQAAPELAAGGEDQAVGDMAQWASVAQRLQAMWTRFQQEQAGDLAGGRGLARS